MPGLFPCLEGFAFSFASSARKSFYNITTLPAFNAFVTINMLQHLLASCEQAGHKVQERLAHEFSPPSN